MIWRNRTPILTTFLNILLVDVNDINFGEFSRVERKTVLACCKFVPDVCQKKCLKFARHWFYCSSVKRLVPLSP